MIIKSHIRGGFRSAAQYMKEQGQNETTRLVEMSDPQANNLDEAFRAMWAVTDGTRVKKPIHHISMNPMKDERLTDDQVRRICERLEERYGYAHGAHQRVIVEHVKQGRQHFHVIWNRVSLTTGRPHYPYMHKQQSRMAAREMEQELGLKTPQPRRGQRPALSRSGHPAALRRAAWAALAAELGMPTTGHSKRKDGKGGKSGGMMGAGGGMSSPPPVAQDSAKPSVIPPPRLPAAPKRHPYTGPNRRRRNLWVGVERREGWW